MPSWPRTAKEVLFAQFLVLSAFAPICLVGRGWDAI
jgi:hypothetical protein